jgi:hypothetical protein
MEWRGEGIDEDLSLIRSGCIQLRLRQGEYSKIYVCVPARPSVLSSLLKYGPVQPTTRMSPDNDAVKHYDKILYGITKRSVCVWSPKSAEL